MTYEGTDCDGYTPGERLAWKRVVDLECDVIALREELRTAREVAADRSTRVYTKYAELLEMTAQYLDVLDYLENAKADQIGPDTLTHWRKQRNHALNALRTLVRES